MIINDIDYVQMSPDVTCSMVACVIMLLQYHNIYDKPENIAELFGFIYTSIEFQSWIMSEGKFMTGNTMLQCGYYMLNKYYSSIDPGIIETDTTKIKLSYIRRKIPVIVTGYFPLTSGRTSNSILIHGYVDDYFIVNDPRGNATVGYIDRFGKNMLYAIDQVDEWVSEYNITTILRAIPGGNS